MAAAVCSQAVFVPIDVVCQPGSYFFYLSYNVKVISCWVWCVNKENETQKGAIEFLNFFYTQHLVVQVLIGFLLRIFMSYLEGGPLYCGNSFTLNFFPISL